MRNIETFLSKQVHPYLLLVVRKVSEFYHNIDRRCWLVWSKWLIFITFLGQFQVSLIMSIWLTSTITPVSQCETGRALSTRLRGSGSTPSVQYLCFDNMFDCGSCLSSGNWHWYLLDIILGEHHSWLGQLGQVGGDVGHGGVVPAHIAPA